MPLPEGVLADLFSQRADDAYLQLLRITHPDTDGTYTPIRLVDRAVALSVSDDGDGDPVTYTAADFAVEGEGGTEGDIADDVGTLRIDLISLGALGEQLKAALRSQLSGLRVRIRLVRESDPNTVIHETPEDLVWKDVRWNNFEAEGRLGYPENWDGEPYPGDTYDPFHFPGLF